jgi:hypothetical protein
MTPSLAVHGRLGSLAGHIYAHQLCPMPRAEAWHPASAACPQLLLLALLQVTHGITMQPVRAAACESASPRGDVVVLTPRKRARRTPLPEASPAIAFLGVEALAPMLTVPVLPAVPEAGAAADLDAPTSPKTASKAFVPHPPPTPSVALRAVERQAAAIAAAPAPPAAVPTAAPPPASLPALPPLEGVLAVEEPVPCFMLPRQPTTRKLFGGDAPSAADTQAFLAAMEQQVGATARAAGLHREPMPSTTALAVSARLLFKYIYTSGSRLPTADSCSAVF